MIGSLRCLGEEMPGIVSVCTAHPVAIAAALEEAGAQGQIALIEATCNQVNHLGGYTGMRPADFIEMVEGIARSTGFDRERLIFGGDHLGPNPWRHLPADEAMAEAGKMMAAYVKAGFRKLHLDCSMGCKGEPDALNDRTTALRAAELCAIAENLADDALYIIGTEIPTPGGAHHEIAALTPTKPDAVRTTHAVHRSVFEEAGLGAAFERVIAIVVQPGVESAQMSVVFYDADAARDLVAGLALMPPLVFEAHSTDYQSPAALRSLVEDGFRILKVGPCLTFALRQTLYGLEMACHEMDGGPLALRDTMERLMQADPAPWSGHSHGSGKMQEIQRHFGMADRIRYYWPHPDAQKALSDLGSRLRATAPAPGLLSQHVGSGVVGDALANGTDLADMDALCRIAVRHMVRPWYAACQ